MAEEEKNKVDKDIPVIPDINEPLLGEIDEVKELKEKLEKCGKEREEYLNGWKRARADLSNYQKDEVKRFEDAIKFANREFMKDVIVVLDSFNLAIAVLEKNASGDTMIKGLYMICSQLESVLKKYGVEKINTIIGKVFDATLEEAISEVESELPNGAIAEIVESGYLYFGKILRPTRVKLAKKKK